MMIKGNVLLKVVYWNLFGKMCRWRNGLTHAPSRREPGKNRLIEKEAFFCETCQRVSKNIQFEDLPPTLMYSVCNLQVEYVSDIFGPLPELLDAKQAFIVK